MKKFKAIASALMACAMVLSMTACDESVAQPSAGGTTPATTTPATTTEPKTTLERDEGVIEAAKGAADKLEDPTLEVTDRLVWMAWWDMDETTPAAELFLDVYGAPANGSDPERAGHIFENINVGYGERYDKLAASITADSSPDFFPFEILDFPYGILRNRYNSIDSVVDVNSEKWSGAKELMDQFCLNGKYYCAFYDVELNNIMYYRTSVIEDAGLQDPRTLYEENNWTWDTFLEMARQFQASGDERYVIDGYNPENDFVASTGMPLVGNDGTQIVSNLYNPTIERVEEKMLTVLQKENLRYPRHELNGWGVNPKKWANGETLFYADGGTWVFQDTLTKYGKKFGWAEDEIKAICFPRDPSADDYYVNFKQNAMMWVKGSTNVNGVKAWLDCSVTTANDPDVKAAAYEKAKKDYGWTDYNLGFINSLIALDGSSPVKGVFDFKNGLGTVSDASACENPIQSLTNLDYLTGDQTYTQLREEHSAAINAAIEEINKAIASN